jgi:hypothetical protein
MGRFEVVTCIKTEDSSHLRIVAFEEISEKSSFPGHELIHSALKRAPD